MKKKTIQESKKRNEQTIDRLQTYYKLQTNIKNSFLPPQDANIIAPEYRTNNFFKMFLVLYIILEIVPTIKQCIGKIVLSIYDK